MPPRLSLLKKCRSPLDLDLPILPFLAPRVFQPWPSSIPYPYGGRRNISKERLKVMREGATVYDYWEEEKKRNPVETREGLKRLPIAPVQNVKKTITLPKPRIWFPRSKKHVTRRSQLAKAARDAKNASATKLPKAIRPPIRYHPSESSLGIDCEVGKGVSSSRDGVSKEAGDRLQQPGDREGSEYFGGGSVQRHHGYTAEQPIAKMMGDLDLINYSPSRSVQKTEGTRSPLKGYGKRFKGVQGHLERHNEEKKAHITQKWLAGGITWGVPRRQKSIFKHQKVLREFTFSPKTLLALPTNREATSTQEAPSLKNSSRGRTRGRVENPLKIREALKPIRYWNASLNRRVRWHNTSLSSKRKKEKKLGHNSDGTGHNQGYPNLVRPGKEMSSFTLYLYHKISPVKQFTPDDWIPLFPSLPWSFREALGDFQDSGTSILSAWARANRRVKRRIWFPLMLTMVDTHPDLVLKVLEATYTSVHPPHLAVIECLRFSVKHGLQNTIGDGTNFTPQERVLSLLRSLYSRGFDFNHTKALRLCTSILARCGTSQVPGQVEIFSEPAVFQCMLDCGLRPNIITYNVILRNALQTGDHVTGWRIHDMMIGNGIETDAYTYSCLLYDAKWRMDAEGVGKIIELVQSRGIVNAHIYTDILHALFLLSYLRKNERARTIEADTTFPRMVHLFRQHFVDESLGQLIPDFYEMFPPDNNMAHDPTTPEKENLMYPQPSILNVMLVGYLSGIRLSRDAKAFYDHFRDMVYSKHPLALQMISSAYTWNIILMAFSKYPELLPDCPAILQDMLAQKPEAEEAPENPSDNASPLQKASKGQTITSQYTKSYTEEGNFRDSRQQKIKPSRLITYSPSTKIQPPEPPLTLAMPDVYTWSILAKIFMDNKQTVAAEKVLSMMQSRGIKPNLVTWSTILTGYGRLQNITMTVDTVRRLREAGYVNEDFSMQTLLKLDNRGKVMKAMREEAQGEAGLRELAEQMGDRSKQFGGDDGRRGFQGSYVDDEFDEDGEPW